MPVSLSPCSESTICCSKFGLFLALWGDFWKRSNKLQQTMTSEYCDTISASIGRLIVAPEEDTPLKQIHPSAAKMQLR